MALTKIDSYTLMYSSNKFPRRIWLKNGVNNIGQLIFMPNDTALPADSFISGQVNLYYHQEDYFNCIDILRNEDPVYVLYTAPQGENGIKTVDEVVGEGE